MKLPYPLSTLDALDFISDWTLWLAAQADTLFSVSVAPDSGLLVTAMYFSAIGQVTVWIKQDPAALLARGARPRVHVTILSVAGRTKTRSFEFLIVSA